MEKSIVIEHFAYFKSIAFVVNREPFMINPTKLENIALTIKPSTVSSKYSFLFELFLKSKHQNIKYIEALYATNEFEYYEYAIRQFYKVSQKLNNQVFYLTLISKFKGYVICLSALLIN